MQREPQLKIRLPMDVKAFVAAEASRNGCSQNSEIVRAVRERMDRMQTTAGESLQAEQPAVVPSGPDCSPTHQPT